MKRKNAVKKILSIYMAFLMVLGIGLQARPAFAESLNAVETKITEFTITKSTGEIPAGGFKLNDFLKLTISWDAGHYQDKLKKDDYFDVVLPKEFRFPNNHAACNFDILAPNGTDVVAKAVVTPGSEEEGGGTIRVTFTDYVQDKYDIKGTMYLNANFNTKILKTPGEYQITVSIGNNPFNITVPIIANNPQVPLQDEALNKWVGQSLNQDGYVRWAIRINHKKGNLQNVVISDSLKTESNNMDGISYVEGRFKLQEVELDEFGNTIKVIKETNISDKVVLTPDKSGFSYNMGEITGKQYILRYESTYKPGEKLKNEAILRCTGLTVTKKQSFWIADSGGQGQGSLLSRIKIVKVAVDDPNVKLKGAVFKITRSADNSTFELTTDDNGEVLSQQLIPGKYKIKEITPPFGYELSSDEYEVEVKADEPCTKLIRNVPITIDVKVGKRWEGGTGGNIQAELFADGTKIAEDELSAPDWSKTFPGLRKYRLGTKEEIQYTVKEKDVPNGYVESYTGNLSSGLFIVNTRKLISVTANKTWLDAPGGPKPTIWFKLYRKIDTVADLEEVQGADIKALPDGTTSVTWNNLPETDEIGNEYTYSVKEGKMEGNNFVDWTPDNYEKNENGLYVSNIFKFPKRDLSVTKIWKPDNLTNIPESSITVRLYKNGEDTGEIIELKAEKNWVGKFEDLEIYNNADGTVNQYTVKEEGENNGKIQFAGRNFNVTYGGTMEDGLTVTNTEENVPAPPPVNPPYDQFTRNIKVTKNWEVAEGKIPVEKIEVELYKNGQPTGNKVWLSLANNWSGEFNGVPVYQYTGGSMHEYTVKETGEVQNKITLNGKEFKVMYTGAMLEGFIITNKDTKAKKPEDKPGNKTDNKNENPGNTSNTNNEESGKKPKGKEDKPIRDVPKTGDEQNTPLYAGFLALAGLVILMIDIKKKKAK